MKKRILLGLGAIIVLLLAVFGRDLLDLYRLMDYVETSTAAYEADGGPWPQLTDACAGCHGDKGNSQHPGYPSLAGQPAAYLTAQLQRFANGQRVNPNMGPLAMTLSEAEIKQIADYYSRQPTAVSSSFEAEPALRDQGRQLVATRACAACHGERLTGKDQNPRLAGQGHDYLVAQLGAFATGARRDPTGAMNALAAAASPEDRKAMAAYLASLSPANP